MFSPVSSAKVIHQKAPGQLKDEGVKAVVKQSGGLRCGGGVAVVVGLRHKAELALVPAVRQRERQMVFAAVQRYGAGLVLQALAIVRPVKAGLRPSNPSGSRLYSVVKSYNFSIKARLFYSTVKSTYCGSYPSAVTVTRTLPGSVPARMTAKARPSHVVWLLPR